jgi:hypothetical protein
MKMKWASEGLGKCDHPNCKRWMTMFSLIDASSDADKQLRSCADCIDKFEEQIERRRGKS